MPSPNSIYGHILAQTTRFGNPHKRNVEFTQRETALEPMPERVVYIIDDDDAVKDWICMLSESYGIAAHPYASGAVFLADLPLDPGCPLVDVDMPGINGLELLDELRGRRMAIPAIVMTGALTSRMRRQYLS